MLIHGTCVALAGTGVLLRGPSGSGKSDLALRLIDAGAGLVADDQVLLQREGDVVFASPPAVLAGLIEVHGIGIMAAAPAGRVPLGLVADLVPAERIERMPDPACCHLLDQTLPLIALAPFQPSAPAKLRLVAAAVASGLPWPRS